MVVVVWVFVIKRINSDIDVSNHEHTKMGGTYNKNNQCGIASEPFINVNKKGDPILGTMFVLKRFYHSCHPDF